MTAWLAVSVSVAALAAAGCGDSDDDAGDSGGSNASAAQAQGTSTGASSRADGAAAERRKIALVMPRLRERYNAGDGRAFCAALTPAGQREVAEYGARIPELQSRTCVKTIDSYTDRIANAGVENSQTPVRIKKIEIDGSTADVTMKGGLAGIRSTATYRLAKQGDAWKLTNPISGARTRSLNQ
jgi:hypothetical protein